MIKKILVHRIISERRLSTVSFGPLQVPWYVFELAALFIEVFRHDHVRTNKMRRLFFLGELHALHVFDITNNIRANLISGGLLIIIDVCSLISRFRLSFFPLQFLLHFYELLEGSFELYLAPLPLLRNGLRTLFQQMDCSSLWLCT